MGVLKQFERTLKEIGIYCYYIKCLKKQSANIIFVEKIAEKYKEFSAIIDYTLSWHNTDYPRLWEDLYEYTYKVNFEEILKDEVKLKQLREIMQNYKIK